MRSRCLTAGVDQFGGEACPEIVVELVRSGRVDEERIDASVRRLLRDKFRLGLFDDPYVDPQAAGDVVGQADFLSRGHRAQTRSFVLLKNDREILPLGGDPRVYVAGLDETALPETVKVARTPDEADVAVVRIQAPFEPRDGNFIEALFHAGALTFARDDIAWLLELTRRLPTVVDIYLDRAAVIPEVADGAAALLASFGATDKALLEIVFGNAAPGGSLPFELPSSSDAVRRQLPDLPYDSDDPLFAFGYGLSYPGA